MEKMMIDYDAYLLSVRVSNGTFYALMRDVAEFCFMANDGTYNENGFFNAILPAIYKVGQQKKRELANHLTKEFSDKINDQNKKALFGEIATSVIAFQNKEEGIKRNERKLDIRLSKENIIFFSGILSKLEAKKISKSEFIRMLLNQYLSMRSEEREYLCYQIQCEELIELANEKMAVGYNNGKYIEEFFPITVDLCCIDNRYYVVGIVCEGAAVILKAYKLCAFKEYTPRGYQYEIDEAIQKTADELISDFAYFHKPICYLRGDGDENNRAEESEAIPAEEYCGE